MNQLISETQLNTADSIKNAIGISLKVHSDTAEYLTNPIKYVTDHFGIPWSKQKDIVEAVFLSDWKIILVRSCNDVGKTWIIACIFWMWLDLYRTNARIVTTATNYLAVKFMQWAAIREHYIQVKKRFNNATINLTDFMPYPTQFPKYLAVGLNPKIEGQQDDPQAKATAFQGHHSAHTLFIIDEAMSTPPAVIGAIEGSILDKGAKALIVFNPTSPEGAVVEIEKNDKRAIVITISTDDLFNSPEYKADPEYFIELADPKAVQALIDTYGEDSAIVMARVKGEYPSQDVMAAINYHDAKRCSDRAKDEKYNELQNVYKIIFSWDVAGDGVDTNQLGMLLAGEIKETIESEVEGEDPKVVTHIVNKYIELDTWNSQHNESMKKVYFIIKDEMDKWMEIVKESNGEITMPLFYCVNDAVGEGSHVPSMFEEWFDGEVICVAYKGGMSAETIYEREEVDLLNRNAEAWYRTKLLMEEKIKEWGILVMDVDTTKTIGQLTSRKCDWKSKLGEPMIWYIEPKEEYKKRAGGKSPDQADTLVMACWSLLSESSVLMFSS